LTQQVEETVRATGLAEVPTGEVGLAILGPLRALDEVAYLRFASVYRSFTSAADFEREIANLRSAEVMASGASPDDRRVGDAERGSENSDGPANTSHSPSGPHPNR
jgi:transcriptional repressor NrdR